MSDSQDKCRAALGAAREALPRFDERESVYCSIRGYHLRALVEAAERALAQEPATSTEQDELDQSVSVAWERFNKKNRELRLRAAMRRMDELGPLPGMISSFETQMGVLWTDAEWKQETSLWAMSWRAALSTAAQQSPAASPPTQKHLGDSVGADVKRPAASGDGSAIRASGGGGQ